MYSGARDTIRTARATSAGAPSRTVNCAARASGSQQRLPSRTPRASRCARDRPAAAPRPASRTDVAGWNTRCAK
ncbi:hypothetical protein DZF91_26525 [Actinomadura logoneensis]|uniref:Uncharacterized protein n=1 Tax=Actinomadura logoneensis TaxID=2293572 RepID=A0A372JFS3_9ACTN|nr:hypothetical protein DZF91_26525 [Actinomadura logoneensis]